MNTVLIQTRRDFLTISALLTGGICLNTAVTSMLYGAADPHSMQTANNVTVPETLEELVAPSRAALLVYDMQAGIVPHVQDSDRVKQTVVRLIAGAHQERIPIFFSRHFQLPLKTIGAAQLRSAMRFQRVNRVADLVPSLQRGSPETQLLPELGVGPDDVVFDKLGMSFFVGTPLEFCLRDLGVLSVIVVGCVAEVGIEPTVIHAEDLGFFTVTVSDACGSMSAADHKEVMRNLAVTGIVADSKAVLAAWEG